MPNLIIIAKITAAEGQSEAAKEALLELVEPTRAEAGCIQYDFHQDLKNPHLFYAYEQWETAEHLQAHGKSDHISAMKVKTKGSILSSELSFLNKI